MILRGNVTTQKGFWEDLAGGVTGIFFRGGKVIFPDFFPSMKCFFLVENFHFGRPKTNFSGFEKWKAKKKKKKKPEQNKNKTKKKQQQQNKNNNQKKKKETQSKTKNKTKQKKGPLLIL